MNVFLSIIYTLLILLMLVFAHEFGHFIVAKACNTKVDELSLGMGPAIWQKRKGETIYSLRALPLGGYCAFDNELGNAEGIEKPAETEKFAEEPERDTSRDLANKKWWQKILILLAGPGMNILFCIFVISGIIMITGIVTGALGSITPGSPAEAAGLMAGDRIVDVGGHPVEKWADIGEAVNTFKENEAVSITYERKGETLGTVVYPTVSEDGQRLVIGVTPKVEHPLGTSIKYGLSGTWNLAKMMGRVFFGLFTGATGKDAVSGPVGMVSAVEQTVSMGFVYVAYIAALISLNLAIFNLLPFPALDGGRILFVLIRLVTGKVVTDDIENKFHFVGIVLLLFLMVFVTFNDVTRLIH